MLPLELDTPVERDRTTLPFVIGSLEMFTLGFFAMIERLFGESRARAVELGLGTGEGR